ncbi:MAG: flavin reductase family protein [Acidimicrobiales bacterium]
MADTAKLVGPFPPGADPEDYDRIRRRVLWRMPTGLYLVGSLAAGERNMMTANLVVQLCVEPKLVGVVVEAAARTHELIETGGCFAVSLLAREDRALVRKFVKPARDDRAARTLNGVAYADAPGTGAPVLARAVAFLDCRLERTVMLGSHSLFVGEVVDAAFGPSGAGEAEVLRVEDTRMSYGG